MSKYNYTKQINFEKKTASEVVDSLVRIYLADHPSEVDYETGLHLVLALHENRKLAKVYGRTPNALVGA